MEPQLVGGECSFYACMPSKALLRPGELLAEVRRIPGVREAVTGELDVRAVLDRRDEIIHDLDDSGMEPWLDEPRRDARARARPPRRRAPRGGRRRRRWSPGAPWWWPPAAARPIPPIDGLREARAVDQPRGHHRQGGARTRLAILGGGVVGVEMAQAWRTLGSQVTLIEAADRLLAREEPFAGEQVEQALRERGVDVRVGAEGRRRCGANGGEVERRARDGRRRCAATSCWWRSAARPHTTTSGSRRVGLEPGKPIEVDDRMRAADDWLYAIGDVNGRALLTHMGKYQARIAADVILGTGGPCLIRRRRALPARDLHRPAGGGRRATRSTRRRRRG